MIGQTRTDWLRIGIAFCSAVHVSLIEMAEPCNLLTGQIYKVTPADTRMALDTSTQLAVERNRLAYERTLMAWVRTGVSLISFGFSIYKFFEEFRKAEQLPRSNELFGVRQFGFSMICIGLVVVLLATIQHITTMHKLRAQYVDVPYSLAAVVALLVAILGILALIGVIFRQ